MNKFMLFISVCVVSIFSSLSAKEFLTVIDNLSETKNYYIIEQVEQHSIAIVTEEELKSLQRSDCHVTVVDTSPRKKIYYLIYPEEEPIEKIRVMGTVIQEFEESLLLRVSKQEEDALFDLRSSLNLIEFDKMIFDRPMPQPIQDLNFSNNPEIQAVVDLIREDSIRSYIKQLQEIPSRHVSYTFNSEEAIPWIANKLREYGLDSVYTKKVSNYNAPNVVGIKIGSKYPTLKKYFLIGGHPDCMPRSNPNYGADDNATGVSCFLEIARVFQNCSFEHTIYFVGYNAEEVGMVGSNQFASNASRNNHEIYGVINLDMIGHTDKYEYHLVSYKRSIAGCKEFCYLFNKCAQNYTDLEVKIDSKEPTSSDHASFWRKGYIALKHREYEKCNGVYHTKNDFLDNKDGLNNTRHVTEVARAAAATLCESAKLIEHSAIQSKPATIIRDVVITKGLNSKVEITFHLKEQQFLRFKLYTFKGTLIKESILRLYSKGRDKYILPLHTGNDSPLAKGVYFVQVQGADFSQQIKFSNY